MEESTTDNFEDSQSPRRAASSYGHITTKVVEHNENNLRGSGLSKFVCVASLRHGEFFGVGPPLPYHSDSLLCQQVRSGLVMDTGIYSRAGMRVRV